MDRGLLPDTREPYRYVGARISEKRQTGSVRFDIEPIRKSLLLLAIWSECIVESSQTDMPRLSIPLTVLASV